MHRRPTPPLLPGWLLAALLALMLLAHAGTADAQPARLSATGYPHADAIRFTPVHPLWSDGTSKRRWIRVPTGRTIDARDPDAWVFPVGTQVWKEFAYGSRIETRYLERRANGWVYATYVWRADGLDADLAPAQGVRALPVADAPDGRYAIPSQDDCRACHAGARTPVLGFGALQLGDALPALIERGLIRHAPAAWRSAPPRIAGDSDDERAARGYLHGNCGHCHHETGVPVPLVLAQRTDGAVRAMSPQHLATALRRMGTRNPYVQMPPIGTRTTDPHGLALVRAWAERRDGLAAPQPDNPSALAARITEHLEQTGAHTVR